MKRINKFISENSKYSRRAADKLIEEKKVKVNGKTIIELGYKIDETKDIVEIENKKLTIKKEKIYIALNKPKGYISTRHDEKNRKTIMDLVPKIENLKPIGRLDKDTEGLILFSNDGEFINQILHPKNKIKKTYIVKIKEKLSSTEIEQLENGIKIDGKITNKAKIKILPENKVQIIISEGRNRQIRKMFEKIKHPVLHLQRTKIDEITLKNLKLGKYRNLSNKEIECFQAY